MQAQLDQTQRPGSGQAYVVRSGEGKTYRAFGAVTTVKARSLDTGGVCEMIDVVMPPGTGHPAHFHRQTDEIFSVLTGEIDAHLGDRRVTLTAGSFCVIPRGTIHAFFNESGAPCRIQTWLLPGPPAPGIEGFLEEMDRLPPGPPDMGKLLPILERYDMEPVAPAE